METSIVNELSVGRIDVMINNTELMPQSPLERLKVDEWDCMIDVNLKGVLYGSAAASRTCRRRNRGTLSTSRLSPESILTELLSSISEPDVAESVRQRTEEMALPAASFVRR